MPAIAARAADGYKPSMQPSIAVLIPCYNEEIAIPMVVRDFRAALPEARIVVCDNNSKDRTIELAREAGAEILTQTLQGKGNVVRRLFADIEADVYILVDGDATYDAAAAPALVARLLDERLDMVNAARISHEETAYRHGHRFGNWLLTTLVAQIFGNRIQDMLSGYRVFSRRFVKTFPALSQGFEIETELTVHALELRMPIAEIETTYKSRPAGSVSKLSTYSDGFTILLMIAHLVKQERPLAFFGTAAATLILLSIGISIPVISDFAHTGLVPRLPTAVLSTGIMLLAFLSAACGLILATVTRGRREMKRLAYLSIPVTERKS